MNLCGKCSNMRRCTVKTKFCGKLRKMTNCAIPHPPHLNIAPKFIKPCNAFIIINLILFCSSEVEGSVTLYYPLTCGMSVHVSVESINQVADKVSRIVRPSAMKKTIVHDSLNQPSNSLTCGLCYYHALPNFSAFL